MSSGYDAIEYKSGARAERLDDAGAVTAVISTFGVVDKDGDVLVKEAFTEGQDVLMCWAHKWDVPIGRGAIRLENDRALFDGRFWLDTFDGEQAYRKVKNAADRQEWSYGFVRTKSRQTTVEGRSARVIEGLTLYEASPVLVGAGEGTRTLALKAAGSEPAAKGAIPVHHTSAADDDVAWDGPAQMRAAQTPADYRRISAYYDDELPDDQRQAYKLPHHRVSDGKVVRAGVTAAMGALLGARGGVQLPESSRRGVYNHLAAHERDLDMEPPDFRSFEVLAALPVLVADLKAGRILSARSRAHVEAVIRELEALLAHADGRGSERDDGDDEDGDDEAAKAAHASGVTRLSTAEVVELLALRARSLGVNVGALLGSSA